MTEKNYKEYDAKELVTRYQDEPRFEKLEDGTIDVFTTFFQGNLSQAEDFKVTFTLERFCTLPIKKDISEKELKNDVLRLLKWKNDYTSTYPLVFHDKYMIYFDDRELTNLISDYAQILNAVDEIIDLPFLDFKETTVKYEPIRNEFDTNTFDSDYAF